MIKVILGGLLSTTSTIVMCRILTDLKRYGARQANDLPNLVGRMDGGMDASVLWERSHEDVYGMCVMRGSLIRASSSSTPVTAI